MAYQAVFKRFELKYLLTLPQLERIQLTMADHMAPDQYGRTTIRNIYYDTPNYRLIRHSLEKPVYKEKLRLRSYKRLGKDDKVFVELKKKYKGIVYKRRLSMPERGARQWLQGGSFPGEQTQISREIEYVRSYYRDLRPAVFLSYERVAWFSKDGGDLRITFDDHILCRRDDLTLESEAYGTELLPPGTVLMEIKTSGAVPLWLTEVLSRERIYKTSFSKYGTAYLKMILPNFKGECLYA